MAVVDQAVTPQLNFFPLGDPVEGVDFVQPRGRLQFIANEAIAAQAAADETHLRITMALPVGFVYLTQEIALAIESADGTNDWDDHNPILEVAIRTSPAGIASRVSYPTTISAGLSFTLAGVSEKRVTAQFLALPRPLLIPAQTTLNSEIDWVNDNAADQGAMTLRLAATFLVYDVAQVYGSRLEAVTPVLLR